MSIFDSKLFGYQKEPFYSYTDFGILHGRNSIFLPFRQQMLIFLFALSMALNFRRQGNDPFRILESRQGEEQLTKQAISSSLGKLGHFMGLLAQRGSENGHSTHQEDNSAMNSRGSSGGVSWQAAGGREGLL